MAANKRKHLMLSRKLTVARIQETLDLSDQALQESSHIPLFKIKFGLLDSLYEEFKTTHLELLALSPEEEFEEEEVVRKKVDSLYTLINARYQTLFPVTDNIVPSNQPDASLVRLPKLELLKFSGELSQWQAYIDVFDNAVHQRTDMSDIHKFQYLLSSLVGEPLKLIKAISLSSANYPVAYKTLVERFSNKRLITLTHWRALKNFPVLTNSDPKNLRTLIDTFSENLSVLHNMGFDVDSWDFPIADMLLDKLDAKTRERFELSSDSSVIPTYKSLHQFLTKQCIALEAVKTSKESFNQSEFKFSKPGNKPKGVMSHVANVSDTIESCMVCQGNHKIFMCSTFKSKSPKERFELIRQSHRCLNCFRTGHIVSRCPSKHKCRECHQGHHTLLHFPKKEIPNSGDTQVDHVPNTTNLDPNGVTTCTSVAQQHTPSTTLLATALIAVKDKRGNNQVLRALIDSGSQASFIVKKCANRLQLPISPLRSPVFGLGNVSSNMPVGIAHCEIKPCNSNHASLIVDAIVLPQICANLPNVSLDPSLWKLGPEFPLADPTWFQSASVDLLLGADVYPSIVNSGLLPGIDSQPMAFQTIFGWALIGPTRIATPSPIQSFFASLHQPIDPITKFWEVEEIPQRENVHPDDKTIEEYFLKTLVRLPCGRFEVALPFKVDRPSFPSSSSIAQRRFFSLERRLKLDNSLRTLYNDFMQDYLKAGHMSELSSIPIADEIYFIPHHPVFKIENGKPKLRVVFDASAKADNQLSLNDTLFIGPKLQNDIVAILLRFRLKPFVFTCDIRQMYRQILVSPAHRKYQLIWWRFSPDDPLRAFQLNTVTYGVSSSPFLAIRTLLYLAMIEQEKYPFAFLALKDGLYVDDVIFGGNSLEETMEVQRQLVELLQQGGFELRKWSSNSSRLLQDIPLCHRQVQDLSFDSPDNILKILGLQWRASTDSFIFLVNPSNAVCTKRSILSQIARIYDPIGFLCPLSFYAKVLIQQLWIAGSNWDDPAPDDIRSKWERFLEELPTISDVSIPRMILIQNQEKCQLHAFCDASSLGYAAVIYFRLLNSCEEAHVKFVIAKSKVAPVKTLSIPRLELCGAVLLSNLVEFVLDTFKNLMAIDSIYAWSDSKVVLSWIHSFPNRFKPFVANRITHIQERVPPECWHYVPTSTNPVDIASRGCLPRELTRATTWWAGPPWLSTPLQLWPEQGSSEVGNADFVIPDTSCEEKVSALVLTASPDDLENILKRFSCLRKVQGTLAFCLRFYYNTRNFESKRVGPLSESELDEALLYFIKFVQSQAFAKEISLMKQGKSCPKWLASLSPFIDDREIIRVGGRLHHALLDFDVKHPMLLPKRSLLTDLIIRQIHERSCHSGLNATLYLIQQRFWILSSRQAIRSVLKNCYRCFRTNPKPYQPPMANLPPSRVASVKPFSCVGVDYGGPFSIIYRRHRGAKSFKVYLCLFVCFATKAIHLEIANDLSTQAFLGALRRFIARRGRCSQIQSDCGTNFVGAARLMNEYLQHASAHESIQWKFNPPGAPHFGGLWEAGIKSVKTHLHRVIGQQILTYEEFFTLITQVEAVLNSRPLTPVNSDPKDLNVLSPGHFLTMEPLVTFPEPDLTSTKLSLLSRWQLVQNLHQSFWSRWSTEYLHTLYQRNKWTRDGSHSLPKVGAMVLIKNEQCSSLQWHIGRIHRLHPGKDGVSRVATVFTSNGTLTRPLVKLCPLPNA